MKHPKNLLAATILAFAIATTTFAGDVGFPPCSPPPPPGTCTTSTSGVTSTDDSSALLTDALLTIISVFG
jgi:hypothetical protein